MFKKFLSITISLSLLIVTIFFPFVRIYAQTVTPTPTPDNSSTVQDLEQQISDLQAKISDLQGQEKTLSNQISVMDNQIQLTQLQINDTQQKIMNLTLNISTATDKITNLQNSIDNLTKVLLNKIVATYEIGSSQPFQLLMSSSDIKDFFVRANYLKIAQAHDKELVYNTVQAKNDYANQKQIYEDEKKQVEALNAQLTAYNTQLDQEKAAKQQLLTETQGSEANYQSILAQTEAQLASFQGFATSQGGASLLSNQTDCNDSWGCYYNQRDSQWGGLALNSTSYSIAEVGCLMTSMAMVYTHYGHKDVNPLSINSVGSNFSGIPPALLNRHIVANGTNSNRNNIASGNATADIDGIINDSNHDPAIVGIEYSSGDTHFVVIRSGSNGNYMMNDPFVPNGENISFNSHYSIGMIFEVDSISM